MQTEHFIGQLVADLRPVHRRTPGGEALVLVLLLGAELALMGAFGAMRPDMPEAAGTVSFWWKLATLGAVAGTGATAALLSLDPARSPRRGLHWMLLLLAACLATGWGIDAAHESWPALLQRLDWRSGMECAAEIMVLSVPTVVALGWLMRRGAPTDLGGSAGAAGLAAAGSGALAFAFSCPYDDPLYVIVWYGLGCGIVAGAARVALPYLMKW